jgi:hypothetical protein
MIYRLSLFKPFLGVAILAGLVLGVGSCTKGNDGAEDQSTITAEESAGPDCATPEFQDTVGCQLVNTQYHGNLNLGPITLSGVVKNTFRSDGKIEAIRFYPDDQTQTPSGEILRSYTPEGKLHVETIRTDQEPPGGGDNIIDFQTTYTHQYNPDGSDGGAAVLSHKLPKLAGDPYYDGGGGPVELAPGKILNAGGGAWFPNPTESDNYLDFQTVDDQGRLLDSMRLDQVVDSATAVNTQKKATLITNTYENGKAATSVMKFYDCPSQPSPNMTECFYVYTDPVDFNNSTMVLHPSRIPYAIQSATYQYDDKGRVSRLYVEVDGDMAGPNPQKPTEDGALDHEWWCDFKYDDSNPGVVIAAFPKAFELFGLSKHDKIASITCDDKQGVASGSLTFDGWAYLHEVRPEVPEPK